MRVYEEQQWEGLRIEQEQLEDFQFTECTFTKCHFLDLKFKSGSFRGCTFTGCVITNPEFKDCTGSGLKLEDCLLVGIDWYSLKTKLKDLVPFLTLKGSSVRYNYFIELKLAAFDFKGCSFEESQFERCDLSKAVFEGVSLGRTRFAGCDLRRADFREATGYEIDIRDNRMKGAVFSYPEVVELLKSLEIVLE